ncbi:MAG: hypothetical protein UZ05_CHB002001490 [Chlorobi bacterium OLB5]|nr:MAG: hypothetical protein UZ05_CHB002001490 [Chlorobi bacterium OLB5]
MTSFNRIAALVFLIFSIFIFNLYAQQEDDPANPRTWKYFKIYARSEDDSIYITAQDDMGIDPKLESYTIVVNMMDANPQNQFVVLGDEADPSAQRFAWNQLSKKVQDGLVNWTGTNKENMNAKRLDYASVFLDVIRQIKIKEFVAPPKKERTIRSTTAYINPYFQLFGGEKLGIPLKRSIGFTLGFGTKYSAPFESDLVSVGMNIIGVSINYNTTIDNLNTHTFNPETGDNYPWKQYNNIFSPLRAIELTYVIPLGNFLEVGVLSDVKFGKYSTAAFGSPYTFFEKGDSAKPMPNNVLKGTYLNAEFRYPFRMFGSTRSQVYIAYYANETHIGLITRESRLAGAVFDFRTNITLKKIRNFQVLFEIMVSNIGEGFALNSFAFGPAVRLSKTDSGKFGVITAFINARFKLGDFFDEREKK